LYKIAQELRVQSEEQRHLISEGGLAMENMIDAREAARILDCSPDDVFT